MSVILPVISEVQVTYPGNKSKDGIFLPFCFRSRASVALSLKNTTLKCIRYFLKAIFLCIVSVFLHHYILKWFFFLFLKSTKCSQRLVICQYCDLEIVHRQSKEHEDYCGARTEPCLQCKSNIMLKEKDVHALLCGSLTPPEERNNSRAKFSPRDQPPMGVWFDAYSVRNSLQAQERGPKNNNVSAAELHSLTQTNDSRVNNASRGLQGLDEWKSSGPTNASHNHCKFNIDLYL